MRKTLGNFLWWGDPLVARAVEAVESDLLIQTVWRRVVLSRGVFLSTQWILVPCPLLLPTVGVRALLRYCRGNKLLTHF